MAEAVSEHASYEIEYSIMDGTLERVQTTVYKSTSGEQRIAVGSIYYDRGSVTVNMPFCQEMANYVSEVTGYIELILADVSDRKQTDQQKNQ